MILQSVYTTAVLFQRYPAWSCSLRRFSRRLLFFGDLCRINHPAISTVGMAHVGGTDDHISATGDEAAEISGILAHTTAGLYSGLGARCPGQHHWDGMDSTWRSSVHIS